VITANENLTQFPRTIGDFVGARPVADDVPEVDDQVEGWSSSEAGVESFQIGVDIA